MIVFVTGNADKARALEAHVGIKVEQRSIEIAEIQSLDPIEVVTHKAQQAYRQTGEPVVVEDTSLTFSALGQLPGPLIKWFLHELKNEGLCRLLNSYSDRSALAHVYFAFYDGVALKIFSAEKKGTIAHEPRGTHGFGWDPVFIPEGSTITWGENTSPHSIREEAAKKLEAFLVNYKK